MRMLKQWNSRVWVGTAVVAALAVGVLLGSSFAPRSEAAAQATVTFSGDAAVVLNVVNPANTADFERAMQAYGETLAGSDDAQLSQMGAGMKLFRADTPGPNGYVIYYQFMDPVVSGGNYALAQVLADNYLDGPPGNGDEVRELYGAYSGALQGGGQQSINLTLVAEF
ncbi:MAG: hypothetical protein VYE68_00975 [Acidobacteriota bacterium]|nr:hypothetical protein [Acidobacteriota bacterium]